MDKKELLELINYQFIKCNAEQVDSLFSLMDKTLEANEKFNLTAIKDRDQFVEKMIFDSALVLKVVSPVSFFPSEDLRPGVTLIVY